MTPARMTTLICMPKAFQPKHKQRIDAFLARNPGYHASWLVDSITDEGRVDEVYCAVVPDVRAFALSDGLMTGNCIMSSETDLKASASCPDNTEVYRAMVELEADSTFAFQGNRWLADVAPDLLSPDLRQRVAWAKEAGQQRQAIESEIPNHLLYTAGWPTIMPTDAEAGLIADVRRRVSLLLAIDAGYLTPESVKARYAELMARSAPQAELAFPADAL
ncbi:MAG: hypothetical protein ACYDEV_00475 [Acidiferrobacter sp.]